MRLPHKLVAIDIETTGLFPELGAEMIELGAVIVNEDLSMGATYKSFIKPSTEYRDAKAMSINLISEETLATAPALTDVMAELWQFATANTGSTQPVLAAWGPTFDVVFIQSVCRNAGIELKYNFRHIDIKSIAWWELARRGTSSNGVTGYLKKMGLDFEGPKHEALSDIVNTCRLLQSFVPRV